MQEKSLKYHKICETLNEKLGKISLESRASKNINKNFLVQAKTFGKLCQLFQLKEMVVNIFNKFHLKKGEGGRTGRNESANEG